jgi:hypothetical protein
MAIWRGQPASRLDRTWVTNLTGASQFSTYFGTATSQIRVQTNLPVWATVDSTAVVTANSSAALIPVGVSEYFTVSPGQVLNFITTSTSSSGFLTVSEMV